MSLISAISLLKIQLGAWNNSHVKDPKATKRWWNWILHVQITGATPPLSVLPATGCEASITVRGGLMLPGGPEASGFQWPPLKPPHQDENCAPSFFQGDNSFMLHVWTRQLPSCGFPWTNTSPSAHRRPLPRLAQRTALTIASTVWAACVNVWKPHRLSKPNYAEPILFSSLECSFPAISIPKGVAAPQVAVFHFEPFALLCLVDAVVILGTHTHTDTHTL